MLMTFILGCLVLTATAFADEKIDFCKNFPNVHKAFLHEMLSKHTAPRQDYLLKSFGKVTKDNARDAVMCAADQKHSAAVNSANFDWNVFINEKIIAEFQKLEPVAPNNEDPTAQK